MTEPVPPVEQPLVLATAFDPSTAPRIPSAPLIPRRDESAAELGLAALADVRASFMRPA